MPTSTICVHQSIPDGPRQEAFSRALGMVIEESILRAAPFGGVDGKIQVKVQVTQSGLPFLSSTVHVQRRRSGAVHA